MPRKNIKIADPPKVTVSQARQMLRDGGLRATAARIALVEWLSTRGEPTSHAQASDHLAPRGFDPSTIYRSLVEMADAGMLRRLDIGDHTWRFELISGSTSRDEHPHFVCTDCGKVMCLPPVSVRTSRSSAPKLSEFGTVSEVMLRGRCNDC